jgi:hypothetical protein
MRLTVTWEVDVRISNSGTSLGVLDMACPRKCASRGTFQVENKARNHQSRDADERIRVKVTIREYRRLHCTEARIECFDIRLWIGISDNRLSVPPSSSTYRGRLIIATSAKGRVCYHSCRTYQEKKNRCKVGQENDDEIDNTWNIE